jgi:hypothetical protein
MKLFIFFLFLFTFVYTTPIACLKATEVLSIQNDEDEYLILDENELGVAYGIAKAYCDWKTTCEYKCKCGKVIFYDLSKHSLWKTEQSKWFKICNRPSLDQWMGNQLAEKLNSISGKVMVPAGSTFHQAEYAGWRGTWQCQALTDFIIFTFNKIRIACNEQGKELDLKTIAEVKKITSDWVVSKRNYYYQYMGVESYKAVGNHVNLFFTAFEKSASGGEFNYCSCTLVPLSKKLKNDFLAKINQRCNEVCKK